MLLINSVNNGFLGIIVSHIKIPYDLKKEKKKKKILSHYVASLEVCGCGLQSHGVESWEVGEWSERTHNGVSFQTHLN